MKWGISTTLCKDIDIFQCLNDIDNFFGIEFRLRQHHFDYEDKENVKKIKAYIRKQDLEPISVHMPDKSLNIASKDEWKRMFSIREVQKGILVANKLGAKSIVVHPGNKGKESDLDVSLQSLDEIHKFAKEWKITILIENTFPGDMGADIETFKYIISHTQLPICLDTSHSYSSGITSELVNGFRDKILHLHISDNNLEGKDDHLLPGEGKIDWGNFWKSLSGFQGSVIFELMPAEDIKERISEIKKVIEEWQKEYSL